MIGYFLLGAGLLLGIVLLSRWFVSAEPRQVKRVLIWLGASLALVAALFLLWAGRHMLAALLLPALLPALLRLRSLLRPTSVGSGGDDGGQVSEIDTGLLRMRLDHGTGVLSGEVKDGRYAGRRLDELALADLILLWQECLDEDPEAARLLEGYLDRVHGPDWRRNDADGNADAAGAAKRADGSMTPDEARAILGVEGDADAKAIRTAYRRLMQKLHPDHGGSTFLASQLNEARRVLLGEDG